MANSLSLSIVLYNSPVEQVNTLVESLFSAIGRLREHYALGITSIYLIDNSDQIIVELKNITENKETFKKHQIILSYVQGHGNIGYGTAHNLILGELDSDFHLILNPDIILEDDALLRALEILINDKSIVMLSPSAVGPYGEKLHLCKRYPSALILLLRGFFPNKAKNLFRTRLAKYEMHELEEADRAAKVLLASGCFMLVRTEALKKIEGFDKRYFLYFEDFDLSLRISKLGRLVYAPDVKIMHAGGKASKKGLWHIINFVKSGFRFFNTHGWNIF